MHRTVVVSLVARDSSSATRETCPETLRDDT
jgi:hypothetical protein